MSKLECVEGNGKKYATEIPYLTSEKRIGTWIDGKPLYRRVVETGSITSSDFSVNCPTDINEMISYDAYVTFSTSEGLSDIRVPVYMANNALGHTFLQLIYNHKGHSYRPNSFYFYNSNLSNLPITKLRIIYEYTKTTN